MPIRNIVKIDSAKCNGCGQCVTACAEGAIAIRDGKARLVSEVYCDGLGACLSHCPQGAISVESRQAAAFDEQATQTHLRAGEEQGAQGLSQVCPGLMAQSFAASPPAAAPDCPAGEEGSQLTHWPIQLKLVSPRAAYLQEADLLVVADCVPFAMGDFHDRFLKGHKVVVGCPKLDDVSFYIDKLAAILSANRLRSLTVVHMEVPCCSGLTRVAMEAIGRVETKVPFTDVTVGLHGKVLKTEAVIP
jgi:Pyruvate/2-oxoacid:ferredoxin oxidoreductase delta subunit